MSTRQSVKMKGRNLDVLKRLPIKSTADITKEELEPEQVTAASAAHNFRSTIPTPPIRLVENYDKRQFKKFEPPKYYIKCMLNSGALNFSESVMYDIQDDDIRWIKDYNSTQGLKYGILSEDHFAKVVEVYELESWKVMYPDLVVDPSLRFPFEEACEHSLNLGLGLNEQCMREVYLYWRRKRMQLGHALIRAFQAPPAPENTSPHVAFRQRMQGRRASHRHPKKNDALAFQKMRMLSSGFTMVSNILANTKLRERIKHEEAMMDIETCDSNLLATPYAQYLRNSILAKDTQLDDVIIPNSHPGVCVNEDATPVKLAATEAKLAALFVSTLPRATLGLPGCDIEPVRHDLHQGNKEHAVVPQRRIRATEPKPRAPVQTSGQPARLQGLSCNSSSDELSDGDDDTQFLEYLRNGEVLQRQMITKDMLCRRGHVVATAMMKSLSFYGCNLPPTQDEVELKTAEEIEGIKQQMVVSEYLHVRGNDTHLRTNEPEKELQQQLGLQHLFASPGVASAFPEEVKELKTPSPRVLRWAEQLAANRDWLKPTVSTIPICASLYGASKLDPSRRELVRSQSLRAFEQIAKETEHITVKALELDADLLRQISVMGINKVVAGFTKDIPYDYVPVTPVASLLYCSTTAMSSEQALQIATLADLRSKYKRRIISDPVMHPVGINNMVYWDERDQRLYHINVTPSTTKTEEGMTDDALDTPKITTSLCAFQPCLQKSSLREQPNCLKDHRILANQLLAPYFKPLVKESMLSQCIKAVAGICAGLNAEEIQEPSEQAGSVSQADREREMALLQIWLHACHNNKTSLPQQDTHVDVREMKAQIQEPSQEDDHSDDQEEEGYDSDSDTDTENKEPLPVPGYFDDIEFLRNNTFACSCRAFGSCKDVLVNSRAEFRDLRMSTSSKNYSQSVSYDVITSLFLLPNGELVCTEYVQLASMAAEKHAIKTNQLYSHSFIPAASAIAGLLTNNRRHLFSKQQPKQEQQRHISSGVDRYSLVNMNRHDLDNPLIVNAIALNEECTRVSKPPSTDFSRTELNAQKQWQHKNIVHSKVDVLSRQLAVLQYEKPKPEYLRTANESTVKAALTQMQKQAHVPGTVVTHTVTPQECVQHNITACHPPNLDAVAEVMNVHENAAYCHQNSRPRQATQANSSSFAHASKCNSKNALALLENSLPLLCKDTFTTQGSMEPKALLKLPHEVSQTTSQARQKTAIITQYQDQAVLNGLKIDGMVQSQTIVTTEKSKQKKKVGQSLTDLQESWRPIQREQVQKKAQRVSLDKVSTALQQSKKHVDSILHGVVDVLQTLPKVHFEDSGLQRNNDVRTGQVDTARLEHTHKVLHAAMAFANTLQSNTESQKIDAKVRDMTMLRSVSSVSVEPSSLDRAVSAHLNRRGRVEEDSSAELTRDTAVDGRSAISSLDPTAKERCQEREMIRLEHAHGLAESNHVDAGAKNSDLAAADVFNTAADLSILSHSDTLTGRFSTRLGRNGRLLWDIVKFRPSKNIPEAPVSLNPIDIVIQNDVDKMMQHPVTPIWQGTSHGPAVPDCPTWQCTQQCTCKDLPIVQALKRRKVESIVRKQSSKVVEYVINKKMAKQHIFAQITKLDSDVKTMYSHNYHDEYAILQDPAIPK